MSHKNFKENYMIKPQNPSYQEIYFYYLTLQIIESIKIVTIKYVNLTVKAGKKYLTEV